VLAVRQLKKCMVDKHCLSAYNANFTLKGKYRPQHKDQNGNFFQVDAVFRYCVKIDCVKKRSQRSDLTTPPKEIIFPADLKVTPEDLDGMQNLPVVSVYKDKCM